jgi:NAD(P)H dehydrogenase (quinone)
MNVLIVHAHHEPRSFLSGLKDKAVATLQAQGHDVVVSDLYAMGFNPVSDRRNFTTVADPDYLQQRAEEQYATEHDGFAPDVAEEMEKVLKADLLVFSFPLWWFGMPAILKGWADRVLAMGKIYGMGQLYEDGVGRGKRALVITTTGAPGNMYTERGINPGLDVILTPIENGTFWFIGFEPLPPIVIHSADRSSDEERASALTYVEKYFAELDEKTPRRLPHTTEFDGGFFGNDLQGRWMVDAEVPPMTNEADLLACIGLSERAGTILGSQISASSSSPRRLWLTVRSGDWAHAEKELDALFRHIEVKAVHQLQ